MFRSWELGRILGIQVKLHFTFLLLFAFYVLAQMFSGPSLGVVVANVVFFGILFGVVLLHELGHALMARHFGIATRDITLLPIGGQARMERMPEEPRQELLIALAGPAVNVLLAFLAVLALFPALLAQGPALLLELDRSLMVRFFWVNVLLAGFNLLPAFPMDGGRVFRAVMAMRSDFLTATRLAARVGRYMAVIFGIAGLYLFHPILMLIAVFVWIAGSAEAKYVEMVHAQRAWYQGQDEVWDPDLLWRRGNVRLYRQWPPVR